MNIKALFIFVAILNLSYAQAQDSTVYEWKELSSFAIDSNEVWAIDGLDNVYISDHGVINKYDTSGVLKFSQSIKSLGNMQQLIPINTMKLVHFSEEQQTLCYLDNTLTPYNDCIELSDRGVINASLVSSSTRPDMIWVFDDLNSTLSLLPMSEGSFDQLQATANLKGVLNIEDVSQITERNGRLYLVEKGKGVYIFDLYGSLVEKYEIEGVLYADAFSNSIIFITKTELVIRSLVTDYELKVKLPEEEITDFKYSNEQFYMRTSKNVHKFRLEKQE